MILFIIYWLFQSNLFGLNIFFWNVKAEAGVLYRQRCVNTICMHTPLQKCDYSFEKNDTYITFYLFFFVFCFLIVFAFLQSVHIIFTCIVSSQMHLNSIYRYDLWLQKCIGLVYLIYRKANFIHKKRWSTLTNIHTV